MRVKTYQKQEKNRYKTDDRETSVDKTEKEEYPVMNNRKYYWSLKALETDRN